MVGDEVLAVCNGLIGDVLDEQRSSLAIPMSLRSGRVALVLDRPALAERFPDAGSGLCVFVPGLMSSEAVWGFPGEPDMNYGSRLAADRAVTPLFLRYNSGRHISVNGQELAGLLDELVAAWPVPVEELTLVGHSMGGLVARSACHYGTLAHQPWVGRVRRLFLLGAPLTGVPLEKLVHIAACTLTTIWNPVTRIIGRFLNQRSAGIKDLRFGLLVDEDWSGRDPDAPWWPRRRPVTVSGTIEHYVITGTLPGDVDHPLAHVVGDPLVTVFSARGRTLASGAAPRFPDSCVRVLPGMGHLTLAHHPDVYEQILAWWPAPA